MPSELGRSLPLNDVSSAGQPGPVVYVMSRDQRTRDNHALLKAQEAAIESGVGLCVLFGFKSITGYRTATHYGFMLDGLESVANRLNQHNIGFSIVDASDDSVQVLKYALESIGASKVYFDFSPLRHPSYIRQSLAHELSIPCFVTDTHNIVPVWQASDKQEVGARTLRPKIHRQLEAFLEPPPRLQVHPYDPPDSIGVTFKQSRALVEAHSQPSINEPVFESGELAAHQQLEDFMANRLGTYAEYRNDPNIEGLSDLSPYLHFGQISSLRIALEVKKHPNLNAEDFLEELIVRKELSDNFCYYNPNYDSLNGAPAWARESLAQHEGDKRQYIYSRHQLERAETHDPAWNGAQLQMVKTGKMHGYMRMYWAKKLLEWSDNAETALEHGIYLNDRYSIDGNDPNGYVGLLWSIAGLHDRGWAERDIFGKVRYMNYNGLKRKFDIECYQEQWLD